MKVTPIFLVIGALLVFWTSVAIMVFIPAATMNPAPSDNWLPWSSEEVAGNHQYVINGCSYCHSRYVRVNDWEAERLAQEGDYVGQEPSILGTERTGPDLSQEGGEHPDDWHMAHFINPRFTRPYSLMPAWEFLGEKDIRLLIAYVQAQGGKAAVTRIDRQLKWRTPAQQAFAQGPDKNTEWLHAQVPQVWLVMPNPYAALEADLERGARRIKTSAPAATALWAMGRATPPGTSIRSRTTSPCCAGIWPMASISAASCITRS